MSSGNGPWQHLSHSREGTIISFKSREVTVKLLNDYKMLTRQLQLNTYGLCKLYVMHVGAFEYI